MTGQVAAVVGGLGLIGSEVSAALREDGWEVVVVEPEPSEPSEPSGPSELDGARHGDLLDPDSLPSAVDGAELVVQCATFPGYPVEKPKLRHTFQDFDALGTAALVAAAEKVGARRYIYFSGSGVPSDPSTTDKPYSRAMAQGERAVLGSDLEGVCIRPTLVYGPRDRTINQIVALGQRMPVVPLLGNGRQQYQPIYIRDVGRIARQAARLGGPQGVFEIGGPQRMPFADVIATALEVAGVGRRRLLRIPLGLARFAARWLPGPLTPAAVDFAGRDDIADLTALHRSFDVHLTPLREGLGGYLGRADE